MIEFHFPLSSALCQATIQSAQTQTPSLMARGRGTKRAAADSLAGECNETAPNHENDDDDDAETDSDKDAAEPFEEDLQDSRFCEKQKYCIKY